MGERCRTPSAQVGCPPDQLGFRLPNTIETQPLSAQPIRLPSPAGAMGCRPALALLLLAAVALLHCCVPAAAAADGMPALDATGITLAHSVRHLLQAFDATPGMLQCSTVNQPYQVPLSVNKPGLYRFRIKAKGSQGNSASETEGRWQSFSRAGGAGAKAQTLPAKWLNAVQRNACVVPKPLSPLGPNGVQRRRPQQFWSASRVSGGIPP